MFWFSTAASGWYTTLRAETGEVMRRLAITFCLVTTLGTAALAQGTAMPFGAIRQDPTLPVEITADRLEVVQETGAAVFSGAVQAAQGTMRLRADRLEVVYAAAGADGAAAGIESLHATGGVTLTSGEEAAEAREATYTIASGRIVLTGDVLLTRGGSLISGDRLDVDLTTGTGVMEGRVTTVLQPDPDR